MDDVYRNEEDEDHVKKSVARLFYIGSHINAGPELRLEAGATQERTL